MNGMTIRIRISVKVLPAIADWIVTSFTANLLQPVLATCLYLVNTVGPHLADLVENVSEDAATTKDLPRATLAHVPDPVGGCHPSYARHFAQRFIDTFAGLGIRPDTYYWMSEVYASGAMDPFIRRALDAAATIRDIYVRVANVRHSDEWHPLFVICENCGRIGTTIAERMPSSRISRAK